jgi:predicted dithiol-disulfide oxidoreductase (DUF899 family)
MTGANLPGRFPNESEGYRAARAELLDAEIALRDQLETVARLRGALPMGGVLPEDYAFVEISEGRRRTVPLSELFPEGLDTLLLYSFMYGPEADAPCPMCTSLLDGLEGQIQHISQRAGFAAVMSGSPEQANAIRHARGWTQLRVLSAQGTDYQRLYFGESADGTQMPMLNVFVRDRTAGSIRHFWGSEMLYAVSEFHSRHMDLLWPLWNALDLTPEGRGTDWYPALRYGQSR